MTKKKECTLEEEFDGDTDEAIKEKIDKDLKSEEPLKYFNNKGFNYWSDNGFPYFKDIKCNNEISLDISGYFEEKYQGDNARDPATKVDSITVKENLKKLAKDEGDSFTPSLDLQKDEIQNIKKLPNSYFPIIYQRSREEGDKIIRSNHFDVWFVNSKGEKDHIDIAGDGACLLRSILCYDLEKSKIAKKTKTFEGLQTVKLISWNIFRGIEKDDTVQIKKIKKYIKDQDPGIFFTQESVFDFDGYQSIQWEVKGDKNSINFKPDIFELDGKISYIGLGDDNKLSRNMQDSDNRYKLNQQGDIKTKRLILGARLKHKPTDSIIVFISVHSPHFRGDNKREQTSIYRKWLAYAIILAGYSKNDRIIISGDFNEFFTGESDDYGKTIRFPDFKTPKEIDGYTDRDKKILKSLSEIELTLQQKNPHLLCKYD